MPNPSPIIQSTGFKRFSAVLVNGSGTSNTNNLIGTSTGASGVGQTNGNYIRVAKPTINDDSANSSPFSSDIPSNAIITGVEYKLMVTQNQIPLDSSPIASYRPLIYLNGEDTSVILGDQESGVNIGIGPPVGIQYKNEGGAQDMLGLASHLTYAQVDNLYLEFKLEDQDSLQSFEYSTVGNNFANSEGPTPSIKLYYYIPGPKVTIKGNTKVIIKGNTKVTIKD
tara:strand:- start:501 stop:1175 length:675 start_codon:yes stop_codon:yes gene_type:complete